MRCRADRLIHTGFVGLLLLMIGCAQAGPPKSKPPLPTDDLDPKATINTVCQAIRERRGPTLWNLLPATYQNDINTAIQHQVHRYTPELWNRQRQVLTKAARVLKSKRKLIVESIADTRKIPQWRYEGYYDAGVKFLQSATQSKLLANHAQALKFKTGEFLQAEGKRAYDFLDEAILLHGAHAGLTLQNFQFDVLKAETTDNQAHLSLKNTTLDQPAFTLSMVRVDKKWVPTVINDMVKKESASLEKKLPPPGKADDKFNTQTAKTLDNIAEMIDKLENANNALQVKGILDEYHAKFKDIRQHPVVNFFYQALP